MPTLMSNSMQSSEGEGANPEMLSWLTHVGPLHPPGQENLGFTLPQRNVPKGGQSVTSFVIPKEEYDTWVVASQTEDD